MHKQKTVSATMHCVKLCARCSCLADYLYLDRILYFIIGGVFGGALAIVLPIAVMALFCYGKQRYNQRKKTISKFHLTIIFSSHS